MGELPMPYFDSWFIRVSRQIAKTVQDEPAEERKEQSALPRKLYKQVHLNGLGDLTPVLELSNSLLRDVPHTPSTFVENGWVISKVLGNELLLKRGEVFVQAPKHHESLIYDLNSTSASIKRQRYTPAVMPDWDRIISGCGWPSSGNARIYLPTVNSPEAVASVITSLDATNLRWHMKTTRREKPSRPDSVVLYVDEKDMDDVVSLVENVVPGTHGRAPGFSIPLNGSCTIGLGLVRAEAHQISYGWSFATEIAKSLEDVSSHQSSIEEKAKFALDKLVNDSRRGKTDVKLPW